MAYLNGKEIPFGVKAVIFDGAIEVDKELSTTSTNPVQNGVIAGKLHDISDEIDGLREIVENDHDLVTDHNGDIATLYNEVDALKQNGITVDDALSLYSTNPVQNQAITQEVSNIGTRISGVEQTANSAENIAKHADALASYVNQQVSTNIEPRIEALEQNGGGGGALDDRVTTVEHTLYGVPAPEPDPEPEAETVSITNLLKNPQYKDGMTNWEWVSQSCEVVTTDADGVCLSLEAANKTSYQLRQKLTKSNMVVGHRYYLYSRMKFDGVYPQKDYPDVYFMGVTLTAVAGNAPAESGWTHTSSIYDLTTIPSGSLSFSNAINYMGVTDYTTLYDTVIHYNNSMLIDLTATFGAGNEPDIATMDRWVTEQYALGFEGTATLALTAEDSGDDEDVTEDTGLVGKVAALDSDVTDLQGEVADLAETIKDLPIADLVQTGTVYPTLDAHYIANIEEARPEYYNALEHSALTFTMLADIHQTPTSVTTIKNVEASSVWAKLVNNDFVMLGGDLINDFWDKADALSRIDKVLEMAEKHAKCPVYVVKGNHDTNEQHKINDVLVKESRLTDKEFYQHANARAEKYGMVVDPNYPYNGYYYVDFPNHKIRMVCLNSTENIEGVDITTSATSAFRYGKVESPNQMAWIKDTALRVDDGWAVMMFSHMPPFKTDNTGNRSTENPNLRALCEAFAAGTGDFAEQGAREFIGHFCGHVHVDSYNNIGGLNYVTVNCTVSSKKEDTDLYLDRTADEDKLSLNSFIVDRATRTVKCIKIGAAPADDYDGWTDSFNW